MQLSNWKWHLDEVFVKINVERHYLWRAVYHEGEVLESYVTKKTDRKAVQKLASIHASFHNHFNSQRSLSKRSTFALNRDVALTEWCSLIAS